MQEETVAIQLADALRVRLSKALTPSVMDSIARAIFLGEFDHDASKLKDILQPLAGSVSGSFPTDNDVLSSNLFARLAFLLGRNSDGHRLAGSVATPYFLAQELVRVALFTRLENGVTAKTAKKIRFILSGRASSSELNESERQIVYSLLISFRWCDPSLGGGVFPIAIINTIYHLGLPLSALKPRSVDAFEICPYAVAAARIRIAHAIALVNHRPYDPNLTDHYVNIHERDALELMPEAPELNTPPLSYDIVVGNPPYVRSDILPQSTKSLLHLRFPSFGAKNLDLYFYFVASGLLHLRPKGILAFVSSASFQRTRHGSLLRSFIAQKGTLRALIDFGELRVFPEASVPHTSVYVIESGKSKEEFLPSGAILQELPEHSLLDELAKGFRIPSNNISAKMWHISKSSDGDLVQALAVNSLPLKEVLGPVYSGIKTGCTKAYVISKDEHKALIEAGADESIFKPALIPTDIQSEQTTWTGHMIILVPRGFALDPACPVFQHLSKFSDKLRSRTDLRDGMDWYSLRTCSYYKLFEEPKIVFPDIAKEPRFFLDHNSFYLPDGAFFIQCMKSIYVSLLNSAVGAFYFRRTCSTIGHHEFGGRLRFKKAYVEQFPIPRLLLSDPAAHKAIERAAGYCKSGILSGNAEREACLELTRSILACYDLTKSAASQISKAIAA